MKREERSGASVYALLRYYSSLKKNLNASRCSEHPPVRGENDHVTVYDCMQLKQLAITYSKGKDQPGKVANPARGQLNRENDFFPVPVRASKFGFVRRVRQSRPASACSSPYPGCIWCLLTRFLPSSAAASIFLFKSPYAIGSVPSSSGHAIAYRWRSLPRVRRLRASRRQGSSEQVVL